MQTLTFVALTGNGYNQIERWLNSLFSYQHMYFSPRARNLHPVHPLIAVQPTPQGILMAIGYQLKVFRSTSIVLVLFRRCDNDLSHMTGCCPPLARASMQLQGPLQHCQWHSDKTVTFFFANKIIAIVHGSLIYSRAQYHLTPWEF